VVEPAGSHPDPGIASANHPCPAAPACRRAKSHERTEMKSFKFVVPLLVLLAFAVFLSGCPGKGKMMDDGIKKDAMMDKK
jgi:hypothetical protein